MTQKNPQSEPETLVEMLQRAVLDSGSKVAFADERGQYSYKEIGAIARAVGARLDREKKGQAASSENVAILLPTVKEFPGVYHGVLLSGRTPVPLNFLLEPAELAAVIADSGADTVITTGRFAPAIEGKLPRVELIEDMSRLEAMRAMTYKPSRTHSADDVATLLYTSGTTGRPKGVELTHRNLVSNVQACTRAIDLRDSDSVLGALPMFHSFALTVTMNLVIGVRASAYFMARFSARQVIDLMPGDGITMLPLVPSMLRMLNRTAGRSEKLDHRLRLAIGGGEPLPRDVAEEFEQIFGIPLLEGYGLTETSPVLSLGRPDAHRAGTVGLPLDNIEVGIFNGEGERLDVDADGEIQVRGPSIMRGYRNQPEETAKVLDGEGWFRTGDIGRFDSDGYLSITGRMKEMIISSGENIYPREIEDALSAHPSVFEAAVIGVPDKTRGEVPYAFVSLRENVSATPDELRDHLRSCIADYKVPRGIEVLTELPHSPTGKILKRTLQPAAR